MEEEHPYMNFYSRASCEARPQINLATQLLQDFYSRASCEARQVMAGGRKRPDHFYSRASCEARPQHYVIILQSQPISCTRRTFLSFFLHHFDEYTEDKLLFKANLPAFFESFHLRLTMFSQYYDSFRIISFFCSNVFYSSLPVIP